MTTLKPPEHEAALDSRADTVRAAGVPRTRREKDLPESLVQNRFTMDRKLGEGSFGAVYVGYDTKLQQRVAIKLEHRKSNAAGQLGNEARLMDMLSRPSRPLGFAEVYYFGKEGSYAILVMDILGLTLEDSLAKAGGRFNANTAAMIAEQAIRLLAYVHSKSIVHRDIKSENFMWGLGPKVHHLYCIDFGMSTRYFIKRHIDMRSGKQLTGTARYASINAMKGFSQSRRDDLEALGHMLMYTLRGSLPWSGLDAPTYNKKLELICEKKATLPVEELCKGYPKEFEHFLSCSRNLGFEERPDFDGLVNSFKNFRNAQDPPMQEYELQWLDPATLDLKTLVPLQLDEPCAVQPEDVSDRSTLSGPSDTPKSSE